MVGLPEHGVKAVQSQVPAQQLVGHAVDLQEAIQLLWDHKDRGMRTELGLAWRPPSPTWVAPRWWAGSGQSRTWTARGRTEGGPVH